MAIRRTRVSFMADRADSYEKNASQRVVEPRGPCEMSYIRRFGRVLAEVAKSWKPNEVPLHDSCIYMIGCS